MTSPIAFRRRVSDDLAAAFEWYEEQALRQMLEAYGSIDILVNNAAVDAGSELTDMSLDEWDRVLRVNLTG